ncbi:hypothetical protein H310_03907 [Aphanomyces invadans]|uniref:Uncharacterized protein n=1 Tax=Aphanomyces invadans TaxID=157072 RepID=A0A024UEQ6_9STRA|nr:hypothetical protein H310_03907 [Aphanomyces invadans]ETW04759.1 hypothetical protein H310_03907 [Aphanomyces invadans]|eukprot:XP_008866197.1 hypothetical protein H310_03907 [Aphanomyces invadans]
MVNAVPHSQRSTLRDISEATGLSLGTLSRNLKAGIIQRRSSRLKPLLTDANKLARVASSAVNLAECQFDDMWDVVHPDEKWFNADKDRRKKFVIRCQPPNSPDLNVLDLGFCASIQVLQYKMVSSSIDDVIFSTLTAFDHLSVDMLENVFLSLQAVMRLVLEHQCDNHFKLPHLRKDALRLAGNLMANVAYPVFLLHESDMYTYLQHHGIPSLE